MGDVRLMFRVPPNQLDGLARAAFMLKGVRALSHYPDGKGELRMTVWRRSLRTVLAAFASIGLEPVSVDEEAG